ncbi:addiction module antidote protein [Blastomonas sp.]|uniref:addiction module antidote protein n=1 Tax=Blastomonas sp. TaxID=1909299 RepID=UPI0035938757
MKGNWWQRLVDRPADLHSATLDEARLVVALRIAVFAHKSGADPAPAVAAKLGSAVLANHLSLIVEAMGQAWPEPFSIMRPCCGRMSPDETLFAGMLRSAARGNRASFDRLTCEMLAEDARNLLFNLMRQMSLLGAPLEQATPRFGVSRTSD